MQYNATMHAITYDLALYIALHNYESGLGRFEGIIITHAARRALN